MLTCPQCKAMVLPADTVCRQCGETLPLRESDAPPPPDTLPGTRIAGNYEILDLLGEGAMGRVYRAKQLSLDKVVAIKVLHKHLASDPKLTKRFHREARAASRLSHPNSLQIIDFGAAEDGTLYIAMEFLEGDDLQAIIEREVPFTPARIAMLMGQILSALDEAHHAGIIHRDLKPENVLVLKAGRGAGERVKVCDFGIAKIQESEGGSAITMAGFVCGTPEYMAPEQARGDELDSRADLYSAGVILYQMLTGSVPFTSDTALGTITKHLVEPLVPPRKRRPDLRIPEALEQVAIKSLAKERGDRYASAALMSEALTDAVRALGERASLPIASGPPQSEPAGPVEVDRNARTLDELPAQGRSRRPVLVVGSLLLLGAAALAAYLAFGGGQRVNTTVATTSEDAGAPTGIDDPSTIEGASEPDAGAEPSDAGALEATDVAPVSVDAGAASTGGRNGRRHTNAGDGEPAQPIVAPIVVQPLVQPQIQPPVQPPALPPTAGVSAFDEGRRLFLANDVPGAIARFEQAARETPNNPRVQKELGRAYMRAGNVPRAVAAYRRYLDLAPQASDRAIIERILEQSGG